MAPQDTAHVMDGKSDGQRDGRELAYYVSNCFILQRKMI